MGVLFSLPLAGVWHVASSCLAGVAFCFTSTAASMFFKSCNCNSSIATRVGFAIIFCLNSMFAWLMKTPIAIKQIEKWSMGILTGLCGGKLFPQVHRICFALSLFHLLLELFSSAAPSKMGDWWGPKALVWLILSWYPSSFQTASSSSGELHSNDGRNHIHPTWPCTTRRLRALLVRDLPRKLGKHRLAALAWILIGSTGGMYAATIALTGVLYGFFAGSGCTLNQFFISLNSHSASSSPSYYNQRSGLAQSSMVAVYCTYLIMSAIGNHEHEQCNPLQKYRGTVEGTRTTTVVLGAVFTFLAIAYSTSRAATQSRALVGKKKGAIELPGEIEGHAEMGVVNTQPSRTESPRYQALLAAVEAGAIPASALDEEEEDEDDDPVGETRDDERSGTRYNYTWFHIIFAIGAMYVAMLLTDWSVHIPHFLIRSGSAPTDPGQDSDVYIGRSEVAMWMRVVSSWVCMLLYMWSLLAPVLMPDR
ncbi:serine incorporator-domain-containing protein [Irpex lacteus]|nr:serine incorporator-domain-containing protein [Irpex lacteus]